MLIFSFIFMISIGYSQDELEHFEYERTDVSMNIIISEATLNGESLVPDDEVGVFTPAGVCGGAGLIPDGFPDERLGLSTWSEEAGQGNGFANGEDLEFRLWDHELDWEIVAAAEQIGGQEDLVHIGNGFLVVTLSAEGDPPQDAITISDEAHDYGEVAVNESSEWTFTITNESGEAVGISSVVTIGDFFTDDREDGFDIEAGGSVEVSVTFAPEEEGDFEDY